MSHSAVCYIFFFSSSVASPKRRLKCRAVCEFVFFFFSQLRSAATDLPVKTLLCKILFVKVCGFFCHRRRKVHCCRHEGKRKFKTKKVSVKYIDAWLFGVQTQRKVQISQLSPVFPPWTEKLKRRRGGVKGQSERLQPKHNILLHSSPPTYTRLKAHTHTRVPYDGNVETDGGEGFVEPGRVHAEGQVLHRPAPLHWDTFISLAHFGVVWVQMRK